MTPCPSCRRHVRPADAACPFCGSALPGASAARRVGGTLLAALSPVLLAACYGMPPKDCDSPLDDPSCIDLDEDGFTADIDCNDDDAAVNPGATEVCDDGVDNDCDELTDLDDTDDCAST